MITACRDSRCCAGDKENRQKPPGELTKAQTSGKITIPPIGLPKISNNVENFQPKMAPNDGAASGNVAQAVHNPLERYYQDLSVVEAEMEIFENNIRESVIALHSEIKRRVESGNAEDQPVILPEHLNEYVKLPSPLPSPNPSIPNKTADDLYAALEGQMQLHQSLLQNKSFGDLLRRDSYFHDVLNELDGLRQWSIRRRAEWRDQRDELVELEKSLNALATQGSRIVAQVNTTNLLSREAAAKVAESGRLEAQVLRQRSQWFDRALWFGNSDSMLKEIRLRFKDLVQSSAIADAGFLEPDTLPHDFKRELDGEAFPRVGDGPADKLAVNQLPSWWAQGSPRKWLLRAAENLEASTKGIRAEFRKASALADECEFLIDEHRKKRVELVKDQESELRQIGNQIRLKSQEMTEAYAKNPQNRVRLEQEAEALDSRLRKLTRDAVDDLQDKDSFVATLEEDRGMLIFERRDLRRRLAINQAVVKILTESLKYEASLQGNSRTNNNVSTLSALHDICCIQITRNDLCNQLKEIVSSGVLDQADKSQIAQFQLRHYAIFADGLGYTEIIKDVKNMWHVDAFSMIQISSEDGPLKPIFAQELEDFESVVANAKYVLQNAEVRFAQPLHIGFSTPMPSPQADTNSWERMSLETARRILSAPDNRGGSGYRILGQVLREFFISPDIAPQFEAMTPVIRHDFYKIVETYVADDFAFGPREIEAFLVYCNYNDELFRLDYDYVLPNTQGWELLDEAPIGGPPRKVLLVAPPHTEDFTFWMLSNQDVLLRELSAAGSDPVVEENVLFDLLYRWCPYINLELPYNGIQLTYEALQDIFAYCSQSGRYFRYLPTVSETGQPVLRRLDQGWKIDPSGRYLDLVKEPKYFQEIRSMFRATEAKNIVREAFANNSFTEPDLHWYLNTHLRNGLRYGGIFGFAQTDITEHKFHMFLRWCGQTNDLFDLRRDGTVLRLEVGWDRRSGGKGTGTSSNSLSALVD